MSHSLAAVAPAYWASLTDEERRLLRHVRIIAGGLLVKVNPPILPQTFVSPIPSDIPTGTRFTVTAGGDLTAAINAAAAADPDRHHVIEVQAGATFTGQYGLPAKTGRGWVTIRSSLAALLPPPGTRITPADAAFMPKIVSSTAGNAIGAGDGTQGWRLYGLEVITNPTVATTNDQIRFGWNSADGNGHRTTPAESAAAARRFIIQSCYVHMHDANAVGPNFRLGRQVVSNAPDTRICDSIIIGAQNNADAQSILTYENAGPQLIENNWLEATGQCFFAGGAGRMPRVEEWPADIIVRRNLMTKAARWQKEGATYDGSPWSIKPTVELKNAVRVLFEGNTCRDSWYWPAFTFDVFDGDINDITVQHNVAENCSNFGQNWAGRGSLRRVKVSNNLALTLRGMFWRDVGITGVAVAEDLWIEHNTGIAPSKGVQFPAPVAIKNERVRLANNIFGYGIDGVTCEGIWQNSDAAFDTVMTDRDFAQNAFVDFGNPSGIKRNPAYDQANWSPPKNAAGEFLIAGLPAVAKIDPASGRLAADSPLKGIGVNLENTPDGSDLGVNFPALEAAQGISPAPGPNAPVFRLVSATTQGGSTMPWTVKVRAGVLDTQGNLIRQPDAIAHRLYRDGVKIQDVAQPAGGPTEFTLTVPEPEILLKLGASALDAAGNESVITAALDVPLDAAAPIPPTFKLVSATWVAG